MKIATFNVNNVNRRLPNLLRWLRAAKPDVVCLQELKSTDGDFPADALHQAGYGAVWRGQKTWNGVAILARKADPVLVRTELPGDRNDHEARYIEAPSTASSSPVFICPTAIRSPGRNSTPSCNGSSGCGCTLRNSSGRTFRSCWRATTMSRRPRWIFTPTRSWDKDALIQPKSRAAFQSLLAQGWTDAIRTLHPSKPMFTFWDYKRNRCRAMPA